MIALLSTLAGLVLLAVAAVEVYETILHGRGRPGPLSERLNRAAWALARRWIAGMPRDARHSALNKVGPLLMPALILGLLGLLLLGHAFIYWPHMPGSFAINPEVAGESPAVQSLYFSGVTLLTLGYGDIVPRAWPMRVVALSEAAAGFGVISLAVTYLVTVYGALERKRTIALSFYHQAEEGADVAGFVTHHFAGGEFRGLDDALRTAARDLQGLVEAHVEHPVIHYFHPVEIHKSLPRMLFLSLETSAVLRAGVAPHEGAGVVEKPDRHTLESSARYLLGAMLHALRLRPSSMAADDAVRWRQRFDATLERFRHDGIRTPSDVEAAWATYRGDREEWEPGLRAFSEYLGYEWEEIAGDCSLESAAHEAQW